MVFLALFAFLAVQSSPAGETDWPLVHSLTLQGINQLYNLDVDGALLTFEHVSAIAPGDPRGHFFEAMVAFWKFNLLGEEGEYDHFLALADTVIDVCEGVLDRDENNASAQFFLGGMYGYRGMARQTQGSLIQAVLDGRKGYIHLADAFRADPKMYDAQMGLGLFEYLIAKAPKSLSWLLSTIGYPGSIEGGLSALRLAAEKGTYAKTEAKFLLAQFLFNEHRHEEAIRAIDELTAEFPRNTLFLLNKAVMFRRNGEYDSALVFTKQAMAINSTRKVTYGEEFAYSTLASIQYLMNDFADARRNFQVYMERIANKTFITNSILYRYGISQEITGDREGALKTYRMVKKPNDDFPWEQRSVRLCKLRQEYPLQWGDIQVLMAGNLIDCKRYGAADSTIAVLLSHTDIGGDAKAEGLYDRARISYAQGHDTSVVALCALVAQVKVHHETWVYPEALLLTGRAYARLGQKDRARASFEEAGEFSDYDSEASIRRQIAEEEKQLDLR